ncbi:MAG TPA: hypothetical protein PL098_00180 [Brevundimonas diminuta]|nr:hypothetical protein [Brevundimonas diminuta]HRL23321.1 hypothetical protein [Brevundimonas diminuta]
MQDLTPQQIIERDRARLATALQSGVNQNPDEVAGVRREARARGVPPEAVQQMRAAKAPLPPALTSWYDMPETAPRTSRFLGQPQNAAVAHDDIQSLTAVEQVFGVLKGVGGSLYAGVPRASGGIVGAFEAAGDLQDAVLGAPFRALDRVFGTNFTLEASQNRREASRGYRDYLAQSAERARPKTDNAIAQAAYSGLESVVPSLVGVALSLASGGGATPAALATAAPTGGEAYGRARDEGKGIAPALAYGGTQGAAEFLGERIGLGPLMDGLKLGSPFLQTLVRSIVAEQVGEQATTVLQDFTDYAMLNEGQSFSDFLAERPEAALQTAIAAAVGAGATTSTVYAADAALRRLAGVDRKNVAAERDARLIANLNAVAEASKLRERDPESFEQFMRDVAEDGPVDTLYVAAETFAQSVRDAGLDMTQVRESVPAIAEQIDNALRDGTDLAIPVEQFAARIAGTELAQPLLDHLRVDPSLPSRAEVKALGDEANSQLEAEVEAVLTAEATTDAFRQSAERVKQSLLDQLNAAGRFTADVNAAYASLPAAYYTVRAAQLGITPEEMAARYPLQIRAELPTAAPARSLEQGRLPASNSLALPDAPTPEVMARASRVELVPLSAARATQNVMDFERFDRGESPGPVVPGFEDKPVAVRREDGEYLIYDGHHRAVRAAQAGEAAMEMYVVDAKDYAPELAGRAPAQDRTDVDALLAELGADFNQSEAPANPPFYSALAKAVADSKTAKAPVAQWLATLKKAPGVKAEELEWTGLEEWLGILGGDAVPSWLQDRVDAKGNISRDAILDYLEGGGVRLEETVLGGQGVNADSRYASPTVEAALAGARTREDAIMQLENDGAAYAILSRRDSLKDEDGELAEDWAEIVVDDVWRDTSAAEGAEGPAQYGTYKLPGADETYREFLIRVPHLRGNRFQSAERHFDGYDDVIGHARFTTRTDAEGAKVLFLEEVQSTHHEEGRERGYKVEATAEQIAAAEQAVEEARAAFAAANTAALPVAERVINARLDFFESKIAELEPRVEGVRDQDLRDVADPEVRAALQEYRRVERQLENYAALLNDVDPSSGERENRRAVSAAFDAPLWGSDVGLPGPTDAERAASGHVAAGLRLREAQDELDNLTIGEGIARAPWEKSWSQLVMKRMIRYAVDNGFDKVAWINGNQQNGGQTGGDGAWFYERNLVNETNAILKKLGARVEKVDFRRSDIAAEADADRERYAAQMEETIQEEIANGATEAEARAFVEDYYATSLSAIDDVNRPSDGLGLQNGFTLTDKIKEQAAQGFSLFQARPILYPAVKHNGRVYKSVADHLSALSQIPEEKERKRASADAERGFVDHRGRFLDRFKAQQYALENDLIREDAPSWARSSPELISENLKKSWQMDQRNRGQIAFGADITQSPSVISLLRTADLSTFLHETGHFFLEVDAHIASQPDAPAEIVDDVNRLLAWFGVPDLATWNAMGLEEKRQYHEQFARGFEAYLFEGKAPTQELRGLFQRFSAWLKNVYRQLISNLNVELTDEVRGVMDRMVAAQEAIRETQDELNLKPIAESRPPFMSEEAWTEYQRSFADATAAAEGELETRLTRDMRWASKARSKALKRLQAQANAQRRQVRAEVAAEVNAEPVNRARRYLTHGLDENGEPIPGAGKLDLDILREMYGDGENALWRRLRRGGKFGEAGNNGLHPDVVAELFGFESGDALVRALIEGENAQQKIAGLTDQRMLERYGDIADPQSLERAADEAVSNGVRARVVATEFAALAQAIGQPRALAEAAKQHAAAIVNRMPLRRLKPQQFFASSARAARLADQAIRRVDLRAAAAQKRNQLVNLQAARYTLEAKAEVDKGLALFKRILAAKDENLARSRDMALVNTVRAILGQYGLTRAKNDPEGYLERVKSYDPQLYQDIKAFLNLGAANAKPFDTMSYEEFQGMYETVRQLWTLSRRSRQIEIDGQLVSMETARKALGDRLDELGYPDQSAGHARAPTDKEKFGRQLQGARAALRRVESWTRGLDGADTGPFRKYIWNPVSAAADQYRVASADYMQRFLELVKPIEADLAKKQKIAAPEIGYTFNNKAELLHAILHTGNQSNLSKLLLGRKWGRKNADGTLDTSAWDGFVQRLRDEGVLTKAHYDFAQSVWDLLEATKPGAQRAHHAMYGRYFDEIAADEVVTPFGTYRGGYVPATTDQFMVQDAALRAEQEAIEDSNSAMFPAASNGFTKSRVEDYTRELALDVRLLPMHIDKVLKFTYLGPPVRDVARLLKGREFSQKLQAFDPVAQSDLLLPWLQRAAKQIVQTPTTGAGGKLIDTFFRELRSRTGMQLMFANLSNVAQQVTGVATLKLRVKQRHLNAALWRYMRGPKQTAEAVTSLSAMMATRTNTQIFEAKQTIEQMLLNPSKYEKLRDFSKAHAYYFQSAAQNITDIVGWSAAYDQAVAEGVEEADAIRFADSVIRETQGSMAPEDVSRFETGPAFVRLFNQFYSFFNNLANLNATEFQIVARGVGVRKGAGRLFYIYLMGFAAQAAVGDAIAQAFRGGWEDEDDDGYLDDLLLWFLESQVKFAVAMVPGVGQAANAAFGAFTPEPYDDRVSVSPAVSSIESSVRVPAEVYQSIAEGESFNRRDIRDTFNLLGLITGTPLGVLGRPVGYAVGVAQGDIEPTGPVDTARGLVTGNPSPESRTN